VEVACKRGNLETARNVVEGIETKSLGYELVLAELSGEDLITYDTEFAQDTAIYAKTLVAKNKILLSNSFLDVTDLAYQRACILHEVGHIHYGKQFTFHRVPILDLGRKFADTFGQNATYSKQVSVEFSFLTEMANIYSELWADKFLLESSANLFVRYALQDKYVKNDTVRLEEEGGLSIVHCLNRTMMYSFWRNHFEPEDEAHKTCTRMIAKYRTRLDEISSTHNVDLGDLEELCSDLVYTLGSIALINERYWDLSKEYCNLVFDVYAGLESR